MARWLGVKLPYGKKDCLDRGTELTGCESCTAPAYHHIAAALRCTCREPPNPHTIHTSSPDLLDLAVHVQAVRPLAWLLALVHHVGHQVVLGHPNVCVGKVWGKFTLMWHDVSSTVRAACLQAQS